VSRRPDDGLSLTGAYIAAAVRCAPPANKPTILERDTCAPFLVREMALLPLARVVLALGAFGWDAALRAMASAGHVSTGSRPRFGHGVEARVGPYVLVGSYHPSQQNTFTGRLTPAMFDTVVRQARALASDLE
jgi:uracil-DNA glycosylase family 4